MKKTILIAIAIISIIACKKEKTTTEETPLYLIKTITVYNDKYIASTYIDSFYYDAQNRLTNQLHKYGSSRYLYTYNYFADSITQVGYNAALSNNSYRFEKHLITSNGLASKSIYYDVDYFFNPPRVNIYSSTDNIYDANRNIINGVQIYPINVNYDYNFTNTLSNGNITKTTAIYTTSSKFDTAFYEFDLTHVNTIGNENYGKSFLGKSNKNLVTKETHKTNGDTKEISLFSYKFDDKDRVVEETKTTTRYNNGTMLPAYINRTNVTYY